MELETIVALAGGVGAARFLEGLATVIAPERLIIIGNTGDDLELHGLHISPDLDTVAYTLAGLADPARGWGLAGDSFACLEAMQRFTSETWFNLGDRDLATHLFRTNLLRSGRTLSEATAEISRALGVGSRLLPMSDDPVRTKVLTPQGPLDFQVYFVERRAEDQVRGISFAGAERALPAPGVLEAIERASSVIVCPSNPLISIGPILAVPGIRDALRTTPAPVAAISPIVGGRALKGPADRMLRDMGLEVSARGVAQLYRDFADIFVMDTVDRNVAGAVETLGLRPVIAETVMKGRAEKQALAQATLDAMSDVPAGRDRMSDVPDIAGTR